MQQFNQLLFSLLILFFLISCSNNVHDKDKSILWQQLHWMVGKWRGDSIDKTIMEIWEVKNDTLLVGGGFTIRKKDTLSTEKLKLIRKDNDIFYMADVTHNSSPIVFKLVEYSHNKYIFENKNHDFPQRIIYHYVPPDSIFARVEGEVEGKMKGIDFLYGRE